MRLPLLKRWLVGPPMPLAQARHERLTKRVALAVFSSDALSSVAYATEEILLVLVLAGAAAAHLTVPIALAITALLVIVAISYQQTIYAYPSGGGSLHRRPGQPRHRARADRGGGVAGRLRPDRLGVGGRRRGGDHLGLSRAIRPTRSPSACCAWRASRWRTSAACGSRVGSLRCPTYVFIVSFGAARRRRRLSAADGDAAAGGAAAGRADGGARPGSSCSAPSRRAARRMTGTEAISNGIPAFRPPESRNAAITLGCMALILGTLFVGITVLASALGVLPAESETVVSQIARRLFGDGPVLLPDPGLDRADPGAGRQHVVRRLPAPGVAARARPLRARVSSPASASAWCSPTASWCWRGFAALLIVIFGGDTHALIPLYAVGVFISFTLSQARHGAALVARARVGLAVRGWSSTASAPSPPASWPWSSR